MSDAYSAWRPSATLETIEARAQLNQTIRRFFAERQVLEVETPVLGLAATVDPFIDSLSTQVLGQRAYLQTSPEFYLKRLLAAGSGDVYALGKVFRQGEKGTRHYPEFTLLEWYRCGWDEHRLLDEVAELIKLLLPQIKVEKMAYRECFLKYLAIDPHALGVDDLNRLLKKYVELSDLKLTANREWSIDRDTALDLLMTHCIEPQLPPSLVFIFDYPASKAALAKLASNQQGQKIARRFEGYLNGVELANGYFELTDADEQRARFENDLAYRRQYGLGDLPYDKNLLAALGEGLPECAGVALGIDRLLMLLCGKKVIREVLSFADL